MLFWQGKIYCFRCSVKNRKRSILNKRHCSFIKPENFPWYEPLYNFVTKLNDLYNKYNRLADERNNRRTQLVYLNNNVQQSYDEHACLVLSYVWNTFIYLSTRPASRSSDACSRNVAYMSSGPAFVPIQNKTFITKHFQTILYLINTN